MQCAEATNKCGVRCTLYVSIKPKKKKKSETTPTVPSLNKQTNHPDLHMYLDLSAPPPLAFIIGRQPGSFRDGMLSWRLQRLAAPP